MAVQEVVRLFKVVKTVELGLRVEWGTSRPIEC